MLQRRVRPSKPAHPERRASVDDRLWALLKRFNAAGYRFRRKATFRSFPLDFVDHDIQLVLVLNDAAENTRPVAQIARDHVLAGAGYTVVKIRRCDLAADFGALASQLRRILEDRPPTREPVADGPLHENGSCAEPGGRANRT